MKRKGILALILVLILALASCGKPGVEILKTVKNNTEKPAVITEPENKTEPEDLEAPGEVDVMVDTAYDEAGMPESIGYPDDWDVPWNTEEYQTFSENRIINTLDHRFSTFAADVDTASYANVRRFLTSGDLPNIDAVRIEEMVNYFNYDYDYPQGNDPVAITTELIDTPWNANSKLLLVGLKARELDNTERKPSNLVFLIDVSGSMDMPNKLPLVKRSFLLLTENLTENDRISIVTYASSDEVICSGVNGSDKASIIRHIEDLTAGGGTHASQGIKTAYMLAQENFIPGGNNRIILATDGDFNIGITSDGDLKRMVEENRQQGVSVTTLGFGVGNLKDSKLEILADNGNGSYHYVDTIFEARKVLVEEIGSTLEMVAKDVKLQLEFNPKQVIGFRQIGYETRQLNREDFADDSKDGGEMGAGHTVTALFELYLHGSEELVPKAAEGRYGKDNSDPESSPFEDELLTVNMRYKEPEGDTSKLISKAVKKDLLTNSPSNNMLLASGVAAFAGLLRDSEYFGNYEFKDVSEQIMKLDTTDSRVEELLHLIKLASELSDLVGIRRNVIEDNSQMNKQIEILALENSYKAGIAP